MAGLALRTASSLSTLRGFLLTYLPAMEVPEEGIAMASAPALCPPPLRLRTSPDEITCNPFKVTHCHPKSHTPSDPYQRDQRAPRSPPYNFPSDFSSYTARICPSTSSLPRSPSSLSPASSAGNSPISSPAPSIKARISSSTLPSAPVLRRKISPTQITLRDLRESHKQLQAMQSEDQLRRIYERQTMEYLYGDFASLDGLQE